MWNRYVTPLLIPSLFTGYGFLSLNSAMEDKLVALGLGGPRMLTTAAGWQEWSSSMKFALDAKEGKSLWDPIDGGEFDSDKSKWTNGQATEVRRALAYICQRVEQTLLAPLLPEAEKAANPAKKLWELLQASVAGEVQVRVQDLLAEFHSAKMEPGESIDKFHGRLLRLQHDLRLGNQAVSDEMVLGIFLHGMPKDGQYGLAKIFCKGKSMKEIIATYRDLEKALADMAADAASAPPAYPAFQPNVGQQPGRSQGRGDRGRSQPGRGGGGRRGRGRGRGNGAGGDGGTWNSQAAQGHSDGAGRGNQSGRKIARDQCANCLKFGHWKDECPTHVAYVAKARSAGPGAAATSSAEARSAAPGAAATNSAEVGSAAPGAAATSLAGTPQAFAASNPLDNQVWMLDSGASYSMTPALDAFETYRKLQPAEIRGVRPIDSLCNDPTFAHCRIPQRCDFLHRRCRYRTVAVDIAAVTERQHGS